MNPRRNPCALTDEDFCITVGMRVQCPERTLKPEWWYRDADRRDADLMLAAQRMRRLGFMTRIAVPSLVELEWHLIGGALPYET